MPQYPMDGERLRQSLESILDDNEDMALMFLGRRERARAAAEAERQRSDSGVGGVHGAAAADDEELVSRAQEQACCRAFIGSGL